VNNEESDMRIGLIADIHGNCLALDVVLAELARDQVDEIICLGDVAALGPQPREVLARLQEIGCPVVMGNTDAWLAAWPPARAISPEVFAKSEWCMAQLSADDLAYIRAFPPVIARSLGNGTTLLCVHGSPRSYDDDLRSTTPPDMLDLMLDGADATIIVGGHTHLQMVRRHGTMQLINPGSVGLPGVGPAPPYNTDVHWAEYAVLAVQGGRTEISLRRTLLDVPAMIAVAEASGMPHVAVWASQWRTV
jgi:putative phosphoesterase